MAGYGIQPIVGCALGVDFGDQESRGPAGGETWPRLVFLAARENGYRSLMRLSSRAFLETAPHERPHIKLAWLDGETDGLIALTGGPNGPLDIAIAGGQNALALARCEELQRRFGDRLNIDWRRTARARGRALEPVLIELGYGRGIPLVATNEPFFATREDYEAHDALLCIAEGKLISDGDRRQLTAEHRFKSRAEMAQLFADLPEALAATVEIAERCAFRPVTLAPILPRFSAERGEAEMDEAQALRRAAEAGLEQRLKRHGPAHGVTAEDYRQRLDFELGFIVPMKYAGYFLIVADFIQWAKAQGIPVGPGRGSGAGSLVAYALTITDLDPLRFGLLFERFLNPERVSMPDFDVDFCQDRRDEVIRYVQEKYGREQVAQIITFGTLQARGRLRVEDALWPGRQAVQARAAKSDGPDLAEKRHRHRAAAAGRARPRRGGAARLRHRAAARRLAPPCLDARRRPRHRRSALVGIGAAVPRSEIRHAGDPVQHEMGRACGPGEVRFPGLKDAHGARHRRKAGAPPRRRHRSDRSAARRCQKLRAIGARRDGRRVPGGKPGHAPGAARHAARPLRGHHRAGGALPARSDGEHPDLLRAQARARAARLHPSKARADPARDLWRHRLPGTGDAGGAGAVRLFARRSRSAAPRHGQEDPQRDGGAAQTLRHRRGRARRRSEPGRSDLRTFGAFCRLRLPH